MARAPILTFSLDTDSSETLFEQIYEALRTRIIGGELRPGSRLPASRRLAEELGVSRATVVGAYDQLEAEGFVEGRKGSGVYVTDIGPVELPKPVSLEDALGDQAPAELLPLHPGRPDMSAFPHRAWGKCFARVARTDPDVLSRAVHPFGDPRLRTAIAAYLNEWRGFPVSPERILMTSGTADAMEIIVRTVTARGGTIAMEDPGYLPLRALVQSLGLQPEWLATDGEGPKTPRNAPFSPMLTLLTPSAHYPVGGTISTARRVQFLKWARNNGTWLIEDDYDSEFRYAGRPIPAMAGLDQYGRTFYIGSFSKIFSETLRLGFLVVPQFFITPVSETLKTYGAKAGLSAQRPLAEFLEGGDFQRHIRRMRRIYAERRETLLALLGEHFDGLATWQDHGAGMHIVLDLPPDIDDVQVSRDAAREGVHCPPLSQHFAKPQNRSGLVLGFCAFDEDTMRQSVKTLKNVIQA